MAATFGWIFVTVLLLGNGGVYGIPLDIDAGSDFVIVPCDNAKIVEQISSQGIAYRCAQGTERNTLTEIAEDRTWTEGFDSEDESKEISDEFLVQESKRTLDDTDPRSRISCDREDYIFNTELGMCIENKNFKPSPIKRKPNQKTRGPTKTNQVEETKTKSSPTNCPKGKFFQPSLGICIPNPDQRSKRSLRNRLQPRAINGETYFEMNIPFFGNINCRKGHHFLSELGICLPLEELSVQPLESFPVTIDFGDKHRCPAGTIYSSEIDSCMQYAAPVKATYPVFEFLKKNEPAVAALKQDYKLIKEKCPTGMAYIAEIDLCGAFQAPSSEHIENMEKTYELNKQKEEAVLSTTTPDPFALKLLPLTRDQVGARKCGENTVFVSELGICLDYASP